MILMIEILNDSLQYVWVLRTQMCLSVESGQAHPANHLLFQNLFLPFLERTTFELYSQGIKTR